MSALYTSTKYEMPAVKLSTAKITKAKKQYTKTYKLRGDLSKAKRHTLKVAKKRIATAKAMLAVNTEIKTALGDKQVIDAKYNDADLLKMVADLKQDAPKLVKSLDASLKTISSEEAAIKAVNAAKAANTDAKKIDVANKAVKAFSVKAFQVDYLKQVPKVAATSTDSSKQTTSGSSTGTVAASNQGTSSSTGSMSSTTRSTSTGSTARTTRSTGTTSTRNTTSRSTESTGTTSTRRSSSTGTASRTTSSKHSTTTARPATSTTKQSSSNGGSGNLTHTGHGEIDKGGNTWDSWDDDKANGWDGY